MFSRVTCREASTKQPLLITLPIAMLLLGTSAEEVLKMKRNPVDSASAANAVLSTLATYVE